MDLQCILLVRKLLGRYLLVEDPNTKSLKLPYQHVDSRSNQDVVSTAQSILDNVLCIAAKFKGILKIIHHLPPPGSLSNPTISVVLVTEEIKGKTDSIVSQVPSRWLTLEELLHHSKVDHVSLGLISQVEAQSPITPLNIFDSMESNGIRRINMPMEKQMLEEANYRQHELDQIKDRFISICGSPSAVMSREEFRALMLKLGLPEYHCDNCFRSLSSSGKGITLEELTLGLCALDPATPHGSMSGQLRCQYIFKFYNISGSGTLTFTEFRDMYRDICSYKKIVHSDIEFETVLVDNWKNFGVAQSQGISSSKFLTIVGQLKFRGTSVLFRLPQSPINRQGQTTPPPRPTTPCPSPIMQKLFESVTEAKTGGMEGEESSDDDRMEVSESVMEDVGRAVKAQMMRKPKVSKAFKSGEALPFDEDVDSTDSDFTIAMHSVKVKRSGTLSDVNTLWDLVGTSAMSGSVEEILENNKPSFDRLPSINAFDKTSKSNEMLSGLRYFEHSLRDDGRGKPKPALSWGAIDMVSVARSFINICNTAVDVLSNESRLVEVSSPCYVLGDVHGNFHDLVCFEKVLWRMGPVLTPATFLFLGDYVDRGEFGFEVIAYLFAQKLLMPSKFILIRGNHEIRSVQDTFTYKRECLQKFGEVLGEEVWEATNTVFDVMPIAATIDKKIFCVHGGIPHPKHGGGYLTAIKEVPNRLSDPSEQNSLAWEIMWNDPVRQDDIDEDESLPDSLQSNDGFIENFSRGTGYMFSSDALDAFLKRNNLSHVIRAHEVKEAGFQLQQSGRLLTVFSSSHYCGSANEAACVLVDNKKIRTIRLDTRS